MVSIKVQDCDIIYLSYDEPNAEKNYCDLLTKIPYAKRVHGVKGSDAAHKACANIAETERFITIDGDNIVDPNLLSVEVDVSDRDDLAKCVISWCGKNIINGLVYGNGGIKCWPKEYVLAMKTHENATSDNKEAQVDFCWDAQYFQMNETYSTVHNNNTPQQAWRAGFREGVKLALNRGIRLSGQELLESHWKNLHMLYVWCMVGADIENGLWAVYGAREGLYKTMCTDWDYVLVRDFEYLNNIWKETCSKMTEQDLSYKIMSLGYVLKNELDIPVAPIPLDDTQSKFFKTVYNPPSRRVKC